MDAVGGFAAGLFGHFALDALLLALGALGWKIRHQHKHCRTQPPAEGTVYQRLRWAAERGQPLQLSGEDVAALASDPEVHARAISDASMARLFRARR